jgi:ubiquinone/menaquinone biosynthesis C-methylase UbiE/DNA-binding transcriptional ArsR family regulator
MEEKAPEKLVALMGSLADPTRLRLLRLLERHELGVAELCHVLQLPQSTVSRHLKVLLDEGWLKNRNLRTANLYRMGLNGHETGHRRLWALAREQTSSWPTLRQDTLRLEQLLDKKRGSVQAFFKGAAGHWDRLRRDLYGSRFSETMSLALLPPNWAVADLGCGTGQTCHALAPYVRRVVGVDQSQAMLAAAARRTAGLSNVELRKGRLEAVPIEDGECDAAILLLSLSYVPEPHRVLSEAARILRRGGRLVVADLLRHDREEFQREMGQEHLGWEPSEMIQMIQEAGLQGASCRALPPEAKGPALLLATAERREASALNEEEKK